ncbi:acyl-CoA dehydrogenase family protein [Desulfatitalea alkaliphila]|uniref:Acyl-CoA dehydrogenase family protein n=1 Tax=Desulfatitalea alkaliphila TaxID=2929485 RepID=A0AA41R3R3_9BACT|nr:acyl-CoA dehydrogenase family protein [Desulfatitalea alkaliphila]MCJ8502682.1 acyl-CoA dehydrogenase family protein [Desulfatitalea alkaliphila]
MLDFSLTPEQEKLQAEARSFAMQEILPVAWYYDEIDDTPLPLIRKAYDKGLINGDIPKKYGGRGWGLMESVVVTEEFAAACPGLATSLFDNSLGMEPLILCENEPLKKRMLDQLQQEFKLICFATSEPTMGSDVAGIRCRAEKKGDDYILNGTKFWITNAGIADYMTIFATTDPKAGHEGIAAFLVEREWEGVSVGRKIPKMGQRGSNTAGIHFDNVRVPAENVLAPPGKGFVLAMQTFSRTRPAIGAFAIGAARSAMEFAIHYAKKRQAFGAAIADFQAIQHKIAEMYQKVETSRLLVWKAAWEADQGRDPTIAASIAKFYATEAALQVADEALQVFGGYGYTKMFPIEKFLRDIRLYRIYEGTSEVQRHIVAGYVLNSYEPVMPPLEELPLHREKDPMEAASEAGDKETAWRCRMCGYVHYGEEAPEECPYCFFPEKAFMK